jgi:hypothetical protein
MAAHQQDSEHGRLEDHRINDRLGFQIIGKLECLARRQFQDREWFTSQCNQRRADPALDAKMMVVEKRGRPLND